MKKTEFFVLFLVSLIILTAPTIVHAANDNVTIDVNISESSTIYVLPTTLNWTSADSGQEGGIKNITIQNIGSLNVTQIYINMDTLESEQNRPYGSDDPTEYSSGSVLTIRNESGGQFYFAGRLEWNWTQDIPTHSWAAVTDPVAWGFFRNTSSDYVWVLGNGTSYGCNDTDAQFAIEDDVDIGTLGTRTPDDTSIDTPDTSDENYGYFSDDRASSPTYRYCIAATASCDKIFIYHFDQRSGFTGCDTSQYIKENALAPGQTTIVEVNPFIPAGMPSGYLNQTILTVTAT